LPKFCSGAHRTAQGKDFKLILSFKMETRHPVQEPFQSEFPAICNHFGVMMTWSRKTRKCFEQFFHFLENDPLWYNFQNSVPKVYIGTPIDVVVLKCRKFFRREMGEIVRYLTDKKPKLRLPLKLSLLSGSRPKSARYSPQHLAHTVPEFIQIGSLCLCVWHILIKNYLLTYFRRSYSRTREGRSFGPYSICMIRE